MKKLGKYFMVLGTMLMLSALFLFCTNRQEEKQAGNSVIEVLPKLVEKINTDSSNDNKDNAENIEILNNEYVGYLQIPQLELVLPIMSSWSYPNLKKAPCRYSGSQNTNDLVIAGHNYTNHFGKLSQLTEGDDIIFTDVKRKSISYRVVAKDVLTATAVEDMVSGEYSLTLFTCSYGGENRITIRCERVVDYSQH